ncbi:MAG TPA: hypothetical protein VFK94_05630, partial [Patescibacteria group bacterium]|nr:hypothetical protein [Patescibacteria group bacterium]
MKQNNHLRSLAKLQHQERNRNHKYSLWQTENNVLPIFSEGMFLEKVNYIHENPVRACLVTRATDYRWSSARIWQSCPLEDEPLLMDKELIYWRPPLRRGRAPPHIRRRSRYEARVKVLNRSRVYGWSKSKVQGPRSKVQDPRFMVQTQGPKSKVQGPRSVTIQLESTSSSLATASPPDVRRGSAPPEISHQI